MFRLQSNSLRKFRLRRCSNWLMPWLRSLNVWSLGAAPWWSPSSPVRCVSKLWKCIVRQCLDSTRIVQQQYYMYIFVLRLHICNYIFRTLELYFCWVWTENSLDSNGWSYDIPASSVFAQHGFYRNKSWKIGFDVTRMAGHRPWPLWSLQIVWGSCFHCSPRWGDFVEFPDWGQMVHFFPQRSGHEQFLFPFTVWIIQTSGPGSTLLCSALWAALATAADGAASQQPCPQCHGALLCERTPAATISEVSFSWRCWKLNEFVLAFFEGR